MFRPIVIVFVLLTSSFSHAELEAIAPYLPNKKIDVQKYSVKLVVPSMKPQIL
jgi:hypothetical protein